MLPPSAFAQESQSSTSRNSDMAGTVTMRALAAPVMLPTAGAGRASSCLRRTRSLTAAPMVRNTSGMSRAVAARSVLAARIPARTDRCRGAGYPKFSDSPLAAQITETMPATPSAMQCDATRLTALAPSVMGSTASRQPGPCSGSIGNAACSSVQSLRSSRERGDSTTMAHSVPRPDTHRCLPNGRGDRSMSRPANVPPRW